MIFKTVAEKKHYDRVHQWIRYHYGSAKECQNPNCNKSAKRYEWSLIKNKKCEKNIKNYKQLCPSCHRLYDMTESFKNKLKFYRTGRKVSEQTRLRMRNARIGKYHTKATKENMSRMHKKIWMKKPDPFYHFWTKSPFYIKGQRTKLKTLIK